MTTSRRLLAVATSLAVCGSMVACSGSEDPSSTPVAAKPTVTATNASTGTKAPTKPGDDAAKPKGIAKLLITQDELGKGWTVTTADSVDGSSNDSFCGMTMDVDSSEHAEVAIANPQVGIAGSQLVEQYPSVNAAKASLKDVRKVFTRCKAMSIVSDGKSMRVRGLGVAPGFARGLVSDQAIVWMWAKQDGIRIWMAISVQRSGPYMSTIMTGGLSRGAAYANAVALGKVTAKRLAKAGKSGLAAS